MKSENAKGETMTRPSLDCTSIEWLRWMLYAIRKPHALMTDDEIAAVLAEFGLKG